MSYIGTSPAPLKDIFCNFGLAAARDALDDRLIDEVAARTVAPTRKRLFTPLVTALCCVFGHLQKDLSLRKIEDWLFNYSDQPGPRYGKALSDARARLPAEFFAELVHELGLRAMDSAGMHINGLRVVLVDGTTMQLARSPANSEYFGHTGNQVRMSCLPVARMLLMACAGTGAAIHAAVAPYRTSEMSLLLEALPKLPPQSLLVGDRLLGSWLVLWRLTEQGSHGLFKVQQARKLKCHAWQGKADYYEVWRRPEPAHSPNSEALRSAPKELQVRIIRRKVKGRWLELCTTLLDQRLWPADELVKLYAQRWGVELAIRHMKADHLSSVVRAKSPKAAINEIYSGVLAYTVVRTVMSRTGQDPWRLSHSRSSEQIVNTSERMREAHATKLPGIYATMLQQIAQTRTNPQARAPCLRVLLPSRSRYPVHPEFSTTKSAA